MDQQDQAQLRVTFAGWDQPYGTRVEILHKDGTVEDLTAQERVRSVRMEHRAGELPTMTLELLRADSTPVLVTVTHDVAIGLSKVECQEQARGDPCETPNEARARKGLPPLVDVQPQPEPGGRALTMQVDEGLGLQDRVDGELNP